MLTRSFAEAVAEAEQIVREAPHVRTELDLAEGFDYLAGCIRLALSSAWGYDRDFPYFVRSATPYTKVGLDNPDTLYFSARIRDDAEYVVTGRRGSTADLSFQVLNGDYSPSNVPDSLTAFDDREIRVDDAGNFELRFGPDHTSGAPDRFALGKGAAMLLVREVFSDWEHERPGEIRIHRVDRIGLAPPPVTEKLLAKRFDAAAKTLVQQLKAFIAFPQWFYLDLPVNTMTEPRLTPGGLATQYSSVGHYHLDDDQALVVTVPVSDAAYQGFQLGTMWYLSMDFINHQTSLTADQARPDDDGMIRYVISERDPGLANWLECTGHPRGFLQIRWQRTSRPLGAADGPVVELVAWEDLPARLLHFDRAGVTRAQWGERVAGRQRAVAARMLG
ncbi:MAG: hypothetical protein ACR2KC_07255 [Acidimicrobiales bacterium]